ncbi:hypothetical protein [Sorangium sp. So ce861]|uniref:hypothetical protein n=1 Tax=Sorangium sp. So ce861 TaxID=3133323 RepID=UPI003F601585
MLAAYDVQIDALGATGAFKVERRRTQKVICLRGILGDQVSEQVLRRTIAAGGHPRTKALAVRVSRLVDGNWSVDPGSVYSRA